jgi:DNA polymerase III delta prime subunit
MKRSLFDFTNAGGSKGGNGQIDNGQSKGGKSGVDVNDVKTEILRSPDLSFSIPSTPFHNQEASLLVDIVSPKTLSAVLGHVDAKKSILQYLTSPSTRSKRALLLSGPSGCGKTLLATLAIQETLHQKWDMLDDVDFSEAITNVSKKKSLSGKPWCALIECIEGLSQSGERASLLKAIKTSNIAMILTCDDAFEPSNKPFREACVHVRLGQNDANTILRILFKAGEVYGLKLSPETASNILISSNQNARLALNTLQLLATTKKTARKGAALSSADETFNLFTSTSKLCAATPGSFKRALLVSSGDSDMFLCLLQHNSAFSSSHKNNMALSNVMDAYSSSDLMTKRFFIEEGTFIAAMSTKLNLTLQKAEKQSLFPQIFCVMSSLKSRRERLPIAAGVLATAFLGEERPLFNDKASYVQDIASSSHLNVLSQVRPSGIDAHDTLLVLKCRTNGRSDYRVLKSEGLHVVGDAQANTWIQKGLFSL